MAFEIQRKRIERIFVTTVGNRETRVTANLMAQLNLLSDNVTHTLSALQDNYSRKYNNLNILDAISILQDIDTNSRETLIHSDLMSYNIFTDSDEGKLQLSSFDKCRLGAAGKSIIKNHR